MKEPLIRSHYCCPFCEYEWEDVWDSACNDECPQCHASDIEPYEFEDDFHYDIESDNRMSGEEFDKYR